MPEWIGLGHLVVLVLGVLFLWAAGYLTLCFFWGRVDDDADNLWPLGTPRSTRQDAVTAVRPDGARLEGADGDRGAGDRDALRELRADFARRRAEQVPAGAVGRRGRPLSGPTGPTAARQVTRLR